jgi:thymidylate synthase
VGDIKMNNQIVSFSTPGAAWRYALRLIENLGEKVITEDGQETKEIRNLVLQVENPLEGWPIIGSGWNIPALEVYANNEVLSPENPTAFDYTYGERLRAYPANKAVCIDQIQIIINKLKDSKNTRRAVASTWVPLHDNMREFHPPCLMVVEFLIRGCKLHMTAFFRSHDIEQAWPQNMYGLAKLLEYVGKAVNVETGSITTIGASAHIYKNRGIKYER